MAPAGSGRLPSSTLSLRRLHRASAIEWVDFLEMRTVLYEKRACIFVLEVEPEKLARKNPLTSVSFDKGAIQT